MSRLCRISGCCSILNPRIFRRKRPRGIRSICTRVVAGGPRGAHDCGGRFKRPCGASRGLAFRSRQCRYGFAYFIIHCWLLAIANFPSSASRASSTWVKIGLAARISQNLNLMSEPNKWLSYVDQEEHRRAFWSTYLVDKLISCGRSRPLAILDEDCNVQLPCDEETFRKGEWKKTYTLDQLLSWDTHVTEPPSPFALTILMASIFGRCTRYVNRKSGVDNVPPWDTNSEFSSLNSSLLLLESYSKIGSRPISVVLLENSRPDGSIDRQQVGHLVFAHTLFHLCYCLLNHPFCLRHRLKRFGRKIPRSFPSRALQVCREHAKQLLDLLIDSTRSGCLIESSFYAYCLAIAGGIHSLIFHFESQNVSSGSSEALKYFQQSMDMLNTLAGIWDHASNIVCGIPFQW